MLFNDTTFFQIHITFSKSEYGFFINILLHRNSWEIWQKSEYGLLKSMFLKKWQFMLKVSQLADFINASVLIPKIIHLQRFTVLLGYM